MRRLVFALCLVLLAGSPAAVAQPGADSVSGPGRNYVVHNVFSREDRSFVASTGAGIDEVGAGTVLVTATDGEIAAIRRRFAADAYRAAAGFAAADSAYHTYDEVRSAIEDMARRWPDRVHPFVLGTSYEGREILGARVSDDSADRADEPGALYVGMHHARERLTTEVALNMMWMFAAGESSGLPEVRAGRQLYIVPMLNPDGGEYDIATGSYRSWRKNRQPNVNTTAVGTDPNRNYGYRWGCCSGSSGNPGSETYRGTAAWSAPEVAAMRDFVVAHPNVKTAISYHAYGDLILYPYGYTYTDVPSDMRPVDQRAFVAMAQQMARTTGYRPEQSSDLYITDGDMTDWMYGSQGRFSFTFELGGNGFYPPADRIPSEVNKNGEAAIYLAQMADCPLRAAGASCDGSASPAPPPPPAGGVVNPGFEDGLNGWVASGAYPSVSPVHSGTGSAALGGVNSSTQTLSQDVAVGPGAVLTLWVQSGSRDATDLFRVQAGDTVLATLTGRSASFVWRKVTVSLSRYGGQTVTLRFSASNGARTPTVFYADDVSVL